MTVRTKPAAAMREAIAAAEVGSGTNIWGRHGRSPIFKRSLYSTVIHYLHQSHLSFPYSFGTIGKSIEFLHQRSVCTWTKPSYQAILNIFPTHSSFCQDLPASLCNSRRSRASIRTLGHYQPSVSNHGRNRSVERGSVHLKLVCDPGERFSFSSRYATYHSQLGNIDVSAC